MTSMKNQLEAIEYSYMALIAVLVTILPIVMKGIIAHFHDPYGNDAVIWSLPILAIVLYIGEFVLHLIFIGIPFAMTVFFVTRRIPLIYIRTIVVTILSMLLVVFLRSLSMLIVRIQHTLVITLAPFYVDAWHAIIFIVIANVLLWRYQKRVDKILSIQNIAQK